MPAPPLELILARNLLAGLTLAALLCNSDGTVVFLNDAAGELLGRRFEELGQLTPARWEQEFGRADSRDGPDAEVGQLVAEAARTDARVSRHVRLRTGDGQWIDAEVSVVPLSTAAGFMGSIVLLAPARTPEG